MLQWIKNFFTCNKSQEQINIPTMQLEDFISQSLIQLCNAIQKAQNHLYPIQIDEINKTYFLPIVVPHTLVKDDIPDHRRNLYLVEFDLAITVENEQKSIGKSNISVVGQTFKAEYSSNHHQIKYIRK